MNNWIKEIRVVKLHEPPVSAWILCVRAMAGLCVGSCWTWRDEKDKSGGAVGASIIV